VIISLLAKLILTASAKGVVTRHAREVDGGRHRAARERSEGAHGMLQCMWYYSEA
jgi:hypothetical protein